MAEFEVTYILPTVRHLVIHIVTYINYGNISTFKSRSNYE